MTNCTFSIRPFNSSDNVVIREVYRDAILSQGASFYSTQQIDAWASLASLPQILDRSLNEGSGWVVIDNQNIEAFALRYPSNHLDLLYCRGRSSRKGYGTSLIKRIEYDAYQEGVKTLLTEASLFSYSLLLSCGWKEQSIDKILIGGVSFYHYRMFKHLQ